MKIIYSTILFCFCLSSIFSQQDTLQFKDLDYKKKLYSLNNKPFSGVAVCKNKKNNTNRCISVIDSGKVIEQKCYTKKGKLYATTSYSNIDKPIEEIYFYYPDKFYKVLIKVITTFDNNGRKKSLKVCYDEIMVSEIYWKDKKRNGIWKYYNYIGELYKEVKYKNGKKTNKIIYDSVDKMAGVENIIN